MKKRFISFALFIILFVNLFSGVLVNAAPSVTTIIACSDFQNNVGFDAGKQVVDGILDAIKNDGITSADGFFCCGDYDYNYDKSKQGIETLKSSIEGFVTGESVFVQGNHDNMTVGTNGLSMSGNNDPESDAYGVFVINEDDYMWNNADEQRIKQTAQNLLEYLNEKLEIGYNKPIFVLSHLALNYNMRTFYDGDGRYAKYIFDVLNSAGEKGLNIVFMFGHNHSNGWDDYLGGSSVYLKKGDNINIANYSKTEFNTYTLNFTYLNAGYIGYYNNVNGADDTLTMTVFEISDDDFTVSRYSSSGEHLLKSAGVTNSYKNEKDYPPDTTVYTSPQTVSLTNVIDNTPIPDIIKQRTVGAKYQIVTDVSHLKNGGKYLLLYKGSPDYVMKPVVVTKANSSGSTRTGYDIEATSDFIKNICISDFADSLWTFSYKNNAWYIGCDKGNMMFSATSAESATAGFSANGNPITIAKSGDKFTFFNGSYYLNYNSRGLINGYNSNPAEFYLYEFLGNTIAVSGGKASKDCATTGEQVTVSLSDTDKCFDGWVASQDVDFDLTKKEFTFTMPDYPLEFTAKLNPSHSWGEYTYNEDATTSADGTKTRECEVCHETETVTAEGTKLPSEPTITPDDRLPQVVLNEAGNGVVTDMRGSWATRVYWGNIGEEDIEYRYFEQGLQNPAGTDYAADYAPRANKSYYFTKPGYYRFVLKCIINPDADAADYQYKDVVYTFYFDGENVEVPAVEMVDGNHVKVNTNGFTVKKIYWGNIGEVNTPYSWFNAFWDASLRSKSYKAMYTLRNDTTVVLSTKGYYNFVICFDDATGTYQELVYTVYAKQNVDIIGKAEGGAYINLDNIGGTVNKVYYGFVGQSTDGIVDYETLKASVKGLVPVIPTENTTITLGNLGYYGFCVNYTTKCLIGGNENTDVTYDIIYFVDNN